MSLVQFVDHCYNAQVAIQQWMIFKSSGSAVRGDYLADAQDDADKARELLETVQAELAATLDAGGEAAKQADAETAAAVILIAEAANAGIESFHKCWEQHHSSVMAAAIRQRLKDGAEAVKPPAPLDRQQAAEIADVFLFKVRSRFEYEARPVDHFWSVVQSADDAGVYDLQSKDEIHEAIANARRKFEAEFPWPTESKRGVSLHDAAMFFEDGDESAATLEVRRMSKSRKPKPPILGRDPEHGRRNLFPVSEIIKFIDAFYGRIEPEERRRLREFLNSRQRLPE